MQGVPVSPFPTIGRCEAFGHSWTVSGANSIRGPKRRIAEFGNGGNLSEYEENCMGNHAGCRIVSVGANEGGYAEAIERHGFSDAAFRKTGEKRSGAAGQL